MVTSELRSAASAPQKAQLGLQKAWLELQRAMLGL